jgi:endonuclease YncB( thermonuclease family)
VGLEAVDGRDRRRLGRLVAGVAGGFRTLNRSLIATSSAWRSET